MKHRVLALTLLASLTSLATSAAHADKLDNIESWRSAYRGIRQ